MSTAIQPAAKMSATKPDVAHRGARPQRAESSTLPAMTKASIAKVQKLTDLSLAHLPQYPFVTEHKLHAGVYTRTVTIPAPADGLSITTGVLINIPTQLVLIGDVTVYMGEDESPLHVKGWRVLLGSAGRKQAFVSIGAFTMIMLFATKAKTIAECEAEFTDETDLLWPLSDTERHDIQVTEE